MSKPSAAAPEAEPTQIPAAAPEQGEPTTPATPPPTPATETPPAQPPAEPAATGSEPAPASQPTNEEPAEIKLTAPEGVTFPEGALEQFASTAKGLKLSQEQAEGLMKWQIDVNKQFETKIEAQRAEYLDGLKKETTEMFTAQGKDPGREMAKAAKAVLAFGGNELVDVLEAAGLSNEKTVVGFFVNLGDRISEDKWSEGSPRPPAENRNRLLIGEPV